MQMISIIVTTKNEEKNIESCLKSIKTQTYSENKIEIIVVDNGSTDRTREIARKYTDKVFSKGPERSVQRNFGMIEKSSGEYIMYLDADMILEEKVVEDCIRKMNEDSGIIALYISETIAGKKFWSRVRNFERSFYDGTVIDCVRFIRKDKFLEAGGFDENLTGPEDWDFDKRIRSLGKTALVKTPICHNERDFNLKKYLRKKKYYAGNFDAYMEKWGRGDIDVKKQFGFWYRFLGVFTEKGKWKKLAKHPVLASGMYVLRFLVGIKFLTRKR